jgi:general secretion pathway protein C
MKWFLLLAGAVLVAIVLALPGPAPTLDASPKAPAADVPAATPVAAVQPRPDSVPVAAAQPAIVLRGLIYRGKGSAESQALLGVDGKQQQLFRAGDPISNGWSLQTIAADHVVVANGAASTKLAVMHAPAAPVATAAPEKTAQAHEAPLAGFSQGGPPRASANANGTATERNRRFLQAVQNRRAANP